MNTVGWVIEPADINFSRNVLVTPDGNDLWMVSFVIGGLSHKKGKMTLLDAEALAAQIQFTFGFKGNITAHLEKEVLQ